MPLVWVFERALDRLEIHRNFIDDVYQVMLVGNDVNERMFTFTSRRALVTFHAQLEDHLLENGWRFVSFSPDRRTGIDRRAITRDAEERRRRILPFRSPGE